MKLAILGFGREGRSLFRFLKSRRLTRTKRRLTQKNEIKVLDQKFDKSYLDHLEQFDLVFRSPGVPYNLPQIQKALKRGVKFSSATKLFFEEVADLRGMYADKRGKSQSRSASSQRKSAPVIGITGTKGKGTASTLLYKILKACGFDVVLGGNIGKPAIDLLPRISKKTLVILELSSFQLQDLTESPHIAVVTDIFPDHLDVHKNMKEYLTAKSNIVRYQKKSDVVFYFQDNLLSRAIANKSSGKKVAVSAPNTLEKNQILAATVARYLGCPEKIIKKTVKKFRGLEHRLEFVRSIKIYSRILKNMRIDFYNDSASTNPQTAAAAVSYFSPQLRNSLTHQLILIAGGKDKNLDYKPLAQAIKKSRQIKAVILFGENKSKIKQVLSHVKAPLVDTKDLESAVRQAHQIAKKLINSQTHQLVTVLFSPGAASFDMFKDYADRGEKYKKAVLTLK